jgi:glycine/D-amino acid oxidase-like deaminating enzyme
MTESADVIVVGAGVHGASIAFHLARRGVDVLVLERETIAAGATGRSSGFVRMHYDLESESRLAFASFPYFRDWADRVGHGDAGFVRTGFVMVVPEPLLPQLRANVAMQQRVGIDTSVVSADELAAIVPGMAMDGIVAAAYEPQSGYADPTGTAAGFLTAARAAGARLVQGCKVTAVSTDGDHVTGVETDRGSYLAPVVVDAAGAWASEVARSAGVEVPVQAWRHDTAFFGLPEGRTTDFPIVIDDINASYFRPEGRELMLVGLEAGNEIGGSPDRPATPLRESIREEMVTRVCARLPWMTAGTFRTAHGGQDGMTPDQRGVVEAAGPEGFYLVCGFSGTGFKIAPAVGACVSELILDGRATTVDISAYTHRRFAAHQPLVGEHPYGSFWR